MNTIYKPIIQELILRYDYGEACDLFKNADIDDYEIIGILLSCKYSLNFDFKGAYHQIIKLNDDDKRIKELKNNLQNLIDGEPNAIFSELVENTKIQLVNDKYIDFLSRVYRLKEAILKYIFVKNHIDKNKFSFMSEIISKRMILKILRKKYKIQNPNLSYAISSYIHKYLDKDPIYGEVLEIINSNKMNELIELRHASIAGHGFKGISKEELSRIYGNPYYIIDDFCNILQKIGIRIKKDKYDKINQYILELSENIAHNNCLNE